MKKNDTGSKKGLEGAFGGGGEQKQESASGEVGGDGRMVGGGF